MRLIRGARDALFAQTGTFLHWRRSVMAKLRQRLRFIAFMCQRGNCYYCGVRMWLRSPLEIGAKCHRGEGAARLQCTAEHLVPQSEGGRDTASNIVAACAHCNQARHKRKRPLDPAVYALHVRRRVGRGTWHRAWVFERGLLTAESRLSPW